MTAAYHHTGVFSIKNPTIESEVSWSSLLSFLHFRRTEFSTAHRNWERVSELKNQKHVQMWCILSEPVGMSIIIINSRNPAPKFKFCSVLFAKNPTVNDASGVTMLFAEVGMIFGVPQNNNNSALHVSYMFLSLSNPW